MVRESCDTLCDDIAKKQQNFVTDIDPSVPGILWGDGKRLSQIIGNLLSNAHKFTPERGSIQLKAFVTDVNNDIITMQIEVIDNGIGISKKQQEQLFIPFEQIDGGINRKFEGAGLGLVLSEHIVRMMGGQIWVESCTGKGSRFAFNARFRRDPPLQTNSASEKFDMILMDINMPEMDGVESTRRIRALEEELRSSSRTPGMSLTCKQIPIIAITANIIAEEVEKYLAVGMNEHIGNPLDYDKLIQTLGKYFKKD